MRLQVKTLSQKSLVVDIDDTQTVFDLKRELSRYPDVGVKPELQKLIYAGKILTNDSTLSSYNIDVKKFLVVMVLKQPEEEPPTTSQPAAAAAQSASAATGKQDVDTTTKTPTAASPQASSVAEPVRVTPAAAAPVKSAHEEMVENIVNMGYPESEVRRALAASFNNPERAIEYLIEGIPDSVSAASGQMGQEYLGDDDLEMSMSPLEMFRSDPLFRNLRRAIQQHPELINDAIQRVGEANPGILDLINENQQEFLNMLLESSEDEGDVDDDNSS